MKKHFKPEDRTLAYQTFFFQKAHSYAETWGEISDETRRLIDKQWEEFTHDFDAFIKSDYNRDDFQFSDCVIGYLEDIVYDNKN